MKHRLPMFLQMEANECGLASLAMIAAYHGLGKTLADLRQEYAVSRKGITVSGLAALAGAIELEARAVKLDMEDLSYLTLPCILHWDMDHFVVLRSVGARNVTIHDPATGIRQVPMKDLGRHFTGVAIEFQPTAAFEPVHGNKDNVLRRWLGPTPNLRTSIAKILGLSMLIELLTVLLPFALQWIVDDALPAGNFSLLNGLALGFALLVVITAATDVARNWLVLLLGADLNISWSQRVLKHLLNLPVDYFERRHSGSIASSFNSIVVVQRLLTSGFMEAFVDGAMAIGTLAMMFVYDARCASYVMAAVGLYALLCAFLRRPLRQANAEQIVYSARQQSHFLETLRGIQCIRLFARADSRRSGWSKLLAMETNAELRAHSITLTYTATNRLLFGLLRVGVIWFVSYMILNRHATIGVLFAFLAYLDQFTRRTTALIDRTLDWTLLRLHIDRVEDIVGSQPEAEDAPAPPAIVDLSRRPPSFSIRNLSYAYGFAEQPVLKDINLDIAAGECVALVGASGCGKTTLVKLLLGLLEASAGNIAVSGVPLQQFGRNRLRAMCGTVMQDDILLSGSLEDNISFFDPAPDREYIRECARMAAIHADIEDMAMGYSTLVGETGSGLSGGQRQRVLLARALYRRPHLLVLDEATSHLDLLSEAAVNAAVKKLQLTRIIVAHRPETIAMADRIIELAHGTIVNRPSINPSWHRLKPGVAQQHGWHIG